MYRADGSILADLAHATGYGPRPEAQRRYLGAVLTQLPLLHVEAVLIGEGPVFTPVQPDRVAVRI